jgi:hypothetical protein
LQIEDRGPDDRITLTKSAQSTATIFMSKLAQPEEQSLTGGHFQTFTQVGGALGVCLCTMVFTELAKRFTGDSNPTSAQVEGFDANGFLYGLRGAYWFCCALSCVCEWTKDTVNNLGASLTATALILVVATLRGMGYIEEKQVPADVETKI